MQCIRAVAFLIITITSGLFFGSLAWSKDLSVTPELLRSKIRTESSQLDNDPEPDEIRVQREAEMRRTRVFVEQEVQLMRDVVQVLDRESAFRWLSGFISARPCNCPVQQRKEWVEAILDAVERNQLPICKEILALAASLVSIESGFHADPPVVAPSTYGGIERVLRRAEQKLFEKYETLLHIPPIPKSYAAYKEKYWPRLLQCRTASDVEVVANDLADKLATDADNFPSVVKKVVNQEIDKLRNVVRSKGSMQLKLFRARQAMKDRGEEFTDQELTEYMYTTTGGVDVGIAALKPMFVQYAARYAKKGDLSWLFFVGMDYHYGPFSSRNMMEQVRIRNLSGKNIAIDGSFLNHDARGRPERQDSETLLAAVEALPSIPKQSFFGAFLLERYPHYIYTNIHHAIAEAHKEGFGDTPFAAIGEIRMGESAEIKFGVTYTTRLYLNKLDRYLNSIPWDN